MTATATKPATLRLHKLAVSNFMRVEGISIDAKGKHVRISGPNASGKTSVVLAIWTALKGYSAKTVPEPIHDGAEEAEIELDLGDYVVTRKFTGKSNTLQITAKDGSKVKRPQELLDGLLGAYSLDPVAFLNRRAQDQVDDVLSICGVAPPVKQVKQITGEDFPLRDHESADGYLGRLSADTTGVFYVRRWEQGRVVLSKAKAADEASEELLKVGGRLEGKETEASGSELIAQLEQLNSKVDEYRLLQREADGLRAKCDEANREIERRRTGVVSANDRVASIERQIEDLHRQLGEARNAHELATAQLSSAMDDRDELLTIGAKALEAVKAFDDPSPRIQVVRERLATVEQTNEKLSKRKQAQSFTDAMDRQHAEAKDLHDALEKKLEALRDLRRHLLDGVDLGIDGLSIGEGELKLHDISFVQASMAERIRVACAVAMRQRPTLRLLRVDEGERLDQEGRAMLLKLADENDWQCVITQVADIDKLAVEITDRS